MWSPSTKRWQVDFQNQTCHHNPIHAQQYLFLLSRANYKQTNIWVWICLDLKESSKQLNEQPACRRQATVLPALRGGSPFRRRNPSCSSSEFPAGTVAVQLNSKKVDTKKNMLMTRKWPWSLTGLETVYVSIVQYCAYVHVWSCWNTNMHTVCLPLDLRYCT